MGARVKTKGGGETPQPVGEEGAQGEKITLKITFRGKNQLGKGGGGPQIVSNRGESIRKKEKKSTRSCL